MPPVANQTSNMSEAEVESVMLLEQVDQPEPQPAPTDKTDCVSGVSLDTRGRRAVWIATARQAQKLLRGGTEAQPSDPTVRIWRRPVVKAWYLTAWRELKKIGIANIVGASLCLVLIIALGHECSLALAYRDHLDTGLQALSQGRPDRAQVEFSLSIRADSKSSQAYYYRALAEVQRGSNGNALQDYGKSIELDPKNLKAYLARAALSMKMHQYDQAIQDCSTVIRLNPAYLEVYRVRASAYNHQQQFSAAIADSTKFLSQYPLRDNHRADALSKRAFALDQKHEYVQSVADYTDAIACDPYNASLYVSRGIIYAHMHEWKKSLEDCSASIGLRPNSPVAYKVRGLCNARLNLADESLGDLDKLVGLYPSVDTHRLRGHQRALAGDHLGSLEDFDYVLQAQPDDTFTGKRYQKAKSVLQATAPKTRAIADALPSKQMPSNADLQQPQPLLVKKGYNLYLSKDFEPAIKYLAAAVQRNPADPAARRYLAYALAAFGMPEQAILQCNALAATGSFLPADQLLVANALAACKQTKSAIGFYNDLLASDPGNNQVRTNLIKTLIGTGAVDEAAQLAAQGSLRSPSLHSHYNKLYQQAMASKKPKAPVM